MAGGNPFIAAVAWRQSQQQQNGGFGQQHSGYSQPQQSWGGSQYNSGYQPPSQSMPPRNFGPPPMRVKEADVIDLRHRRRPEDELPRVSEDTSCHIFSVAHSGISKLPEKLHKDKLHPLFVRKCDDRSDFDVRAAELSQFIDFGVENDNWKIFMNGVRLASTEAGIKPKQIYDVVGGVDDMAKKLDFENGGGNQDILEVVRAMMAQQQQLFQTMWLQQVSGANASAPSAPTVAPEAAAAPAPPGSAMPPPPSVDANQLRERFIGTPVTIRAARDDPASGNPRPPQRARSAEPAADVAMSGAPAS